MYILFPMLQSAQDSGWEQENRVQMAAFRSGGEREEDCCNNYNASSELDNIYGSNRQSVED